MNESLRKAWYRLDLTVLPRGVVAIDATANAAALWFGPVASILEELVEKLPRESHPEVAFLGDRRTYPVAHILKSLAGRPDAAVSVAAQLGRYPVIGPLLWELSKGPSRPLVMLVNSPIPDIEDWAVPDFTGRTLVYRMTGTGPYSHPAFREVGAETDLGLLVDHLRDPIQSIRIGREFALAVEWDNDNYDWVDGELIGRLPAPLEVVAAFLHPDAHQPEVVAKRAGGAEHRFLPAPTPPPEPQPDLRLTSAEGNVLHLWQRGTPFWCAACSRSHPPGQFRCQSPASPVGLFPTLATHFSALAFLAELRAGEWFLSPLNRGILARCDGRALVNREGAAPEYQFESGKWEPFADEADAVVSIDSVSFLIRQRNQREK